MATIALLACDADADLGRETLWQTSSAGRDIHVLDADSGEVIRRITVGPEPHGVAMSPDGRTLYVSLEANGRERGELLWIDVAQYRVIHRLAVGPEPHEIEVTPDGRFVYVPCRDGSYWVVDARSRRVVARIPTGGRPHNVVAAPDGRAVYLAAMGKPARLVVADPAAGHRVVGEIVFAASVRPVALSADGRFLFQQIDGLNGFAVADTSRREVIRTVRHQIPLGWLRLPLAELGWIAADGLHRCHGIATRPQQGDVWSACGRRLNVHAADPPAFPERASVGLIDDAYWISFAPDGRHAYAAITERDLVAKIDARDRRVMAYFPVGRRPKRNLVIGATHENR